MNANNLSVCTDASDTSNLKWFTFVQNNSGGRFVKDDLVDQYVIIQAPNATIANSLASKLDIYFNGVDAGYDCECCGDRWSEQWSDKWDEGTDVPMIYGDPVDCSTDVASTVNPPSSAYSDGKVKVYPYSVISQM